MPRRKALDIAPLFELLASEVARHLNKELQRRWDIIDQRLARIESALKTRPAGVSDAVRAAKEPRLCAVADCERAVRAKGLCGAHYQQLRYRLARESEGRSVKTRSSLRIPQPAEDDDPGQKAAAVHMIIRRKSKSPAEADQGSVANGEPASEAQPSSVAGEQQRNLHPSLRPIV